MQRSLFLKLADFLVRFVITLLLTKQVHETMQHARISLSKLDSSPIVQDGVFVISSEVFDIGLGQQQSRPGGTLGGCRLQQGLGLSQILFFPFLGILNQPGRLTELAEGASSSLDLSYLILNPIHGGLIFRL